MKLLSKIDMAEATRLTREGRLREAMALLRGGTPQTVSGAPQASRAAMPDLLKGLARRIGSALPAGAARPGGSLPGSLNPGALPEGGIFSRGLPQGLGGLAARAPAPPVPEGARFEERNFSNEAGTRGYRLYVPSGYTGEPVALIVMLHGCTQSPDDFAAGTGMNALAEERTFLVAYPAQPQSANASRCWNWFNAGDQERDRGEPSILAGLTREVMRDFAVDPQRVFVAGLSAGGATAAIMGAAYPDLYAGIGVHSGLACGAAADMPSAFAAMKQGGGAMRRKGGAPIRAIVFHGDRDPTVAPVNGDQVAAQASGGADLRASSIHGSSPGGVDYTQTVHRDGQGRVMLEQWALHGSGHAWSGGSSAGSYTDPKGPDASREMVRFFLHPSD